MQSFSPFFFLIPHPRLRPFKTLCFINKCSCALTIKTFVGVMSGNYPRRLFFKKSIWFIMGFCLFVCFYFFFSSFLFPSSSSRNEERASIHSPNSVPFWNCFFFTLRRCCVCFSLSLSPHQPLTELETTIYTDRGCRDNLSISCLCNRTEKRCQTLLPYTPKRSIN